MPLSPILRVPVVPPLTVDVLALGGELKNTVAFGHGREVEVSEVHGDLGGPDAYRRFLKTVTGYGTRCRGEDCVIAHDQHPMYSSTAFALQQAQPRVAIQHHHAHAVSCAVDADVPFPVIAVVCDGAGYGVDGAVWGGEVAICDAYNFTRLSHFDYFHIPGGDAAARWTWRPAIALLRAALPDRWRSVGVGALSDVPATERLIVSRQLDADLNAPVTSSLGRLFDAVACLTGVCLCNDREGRAAIDLERTAERGWTRNDSLVAAYPFGLLRTDDGPARIDWRPMIRSVVADQEGGVDVACIAARFHATVVVMLAAAVETAASKTGIHRVVFSGGCFHNRLLRCTLADVLASRGYAVALHRRVSCGDAGLSLGQVVIAAAVAARVHRGGAAVGQRV